MKLLPIIGFSIFSIILFTSTSYAYSMSNTDFILQTDSLSTSINQSNNAINTQVTPPQSFTGQNYTIEYQTQPNMPFAAS